MNRKEGRTNVKGGGSEKGKVGRKEKERILQNLHPSLPAHQKLFI